MNRRWLCLALFALAGCATYRAEFTLYDDGDYRLPAAKEKEPPPSWGVSPLPAGGLLSDDWKVEPLKFKNQGPAQFIVFYKHQRFDANLSVAALPLSDQDVHKTVSTLGERVLNTLRATIRLSIGVAVPTESIAIDGTEGQETIYSISRAGDSAPVSRSYVAVLKPFSLQQMLIITYSAPPGQFESGLADAKSLVHRFHFDSDGVPKSPGSGKPLEKKPDEPAPPKEPSKPRYLPPGAAVPG